MIRVLDGDTIGSGLGLEEPLGVVVLDCPKLLWDENLVFLLGFRLQNLVILD